MKNRVVVVTGGAGHLGSAVCTKLASAGASIAIIDKNKDAGEKLAASLENDFSVKAAFFDFNLLDENVFPKIREAIVSEFGGIDALVNNAAFYDSCPGWGVPFEQEGYQAWLKVMQVNVLAPFFLVQAFAKDLEKSKSGSVVNVSTIYAEVGPDPSLYEGTDMTNEAAYTASKGGLSALTRWLSSNLAPKVRVNTVTPGGIERGQAAVFKERYEKRTPLGRMASEEDIANAIAFLVSSESAYITGQNLIVDGGWTSW